MPYSLKGRNVLITGGSRGLGAYIARAFAAEGANIAINYFNNATPAEKLASELKEEYGVNAVVLKGNAEDRVDLETLVASTVSELGGLDIAIANAGWTKFSTFGDMDALDDGEWDRCWQANVMGPRHLLRAAMPTFKANKDGGVFLISSSIAGVSIGGSSMAYSVTKAAQLHMMKCLASTQGAEGKVRINAVLPGLLLTDWGNQYGKEMIERLRQAAVLKRETDLQDCADAYVMLARNTSVTGQRVHVDSGLKIDHM